MAERPAGYYDRAFATRARRCTGCRRPEGALVQAWRNGAYAVPFGTGHAALLDARGVPVLDPAAIRRQFADEDSRLVEVTLDSGGVCRRCAHLNRGGR